MTRRFFSFLALLVVILTGIFLFVLAGLTLKPVFTKSDSREEIKAVFNDENLKPLDFDSPSLSIFGQARILEGNTSRIGEDLNLFVRINWLEPQVTLPRDQFSRISLPPFLVKDLVILKDSTLEESPQGLKKELILRYKISCSSCLPGKEYGLTFPIKFIKNDKSLMRSLTIEESPIRFVYFFGDHSRDFRDITGPIEASGFKTKGMAMLGGGLLLSVFGGVMMVPFLRKFRKKKSPATPGLNEIFLSRVRELEELSRLENTDLEELLERCWLLLARFLFQKEGIDIIGEDIQMPEEIRSYLDEALAILEKNYSRFPPKREDLNPLWEALGKLGASNLYKGGG